MGDTEIQTISEAGHSCPEKRARLKGFLRPPQWQSASLMIHYGAPSPASAQDVPTCTTLPFDSTAWRWVGLAATLFYISTMKPSKAGQWASGISVQWACTMVDHVRGDQRMKASRRNEDLGEKGLESQYGSSRLPFQFL